MLKILVIDDSSTVLLSVRETLLAAGYGVNACESARTAARMATRELFDLIVTDIYMPDGDGLEIIRDLRKVRPNIPFIAMSGVTGQLNTIKVAKHMGASETLQKPFSAEALLAAGEAAIGKSPAADAVRSQPVNPTNPNKRNASERPKQGGDSR